MHIDLNYQLLESNQCPGCMAYYIRSGIGYPEGIHCNHCGLTVPHEKYKQVMREFLSRKFQQKDDEDD